MGLRMFRLKIMLLKGLWKGSKRKNKKKFYMIKKDLSKIKKINTAMLKTMVITTMQEELVKTVVMELMPTIL